VATVYFRFAAHGSDAPLRAPLLEALLARAARSVSIVDWRVDALRVIVPEMAAAPDAKDLPSVAAIALNGSSTARWACVATPMHLDAGLSTVSLPPDGLLELQTDEAIELMQSFNRTFGGELVQMRVGAAATLICEFDQPLNVTTHDPETLVGHDLFGAQATGPDASHLRRLMSEIELWLFDHAVNRVRSAAGKATLNGLWLWGGGATNVRIPTVCGWAAGRDPLFAAFGEAPEWPGCNEPPRTGEPDRAGEPPRSGEPTRSGEPPGSGEQRPGVIVTRSQPGGSEWADVEKCWLQPAAAALESGALATLDLSSAGRRYSINRGIHWRFWRRARPWWESFEIMNGEVQ
jgi:hypothetical protein